MFEETGKYLEIPVNKKIFLSRHAKGRGKNEVLSRPSKVCLT